MSRIITLLTDFGLRDPYVGEMKGRILGLLETARLVDLTHAVPSGDIAAGAFLLARAWPAFPEGTVHVAVVDPGVGTGRAGLAVQAAGHWFVGPDNALLSMAAREAERIWRLDPDRIAPGLPVSRTFHGRDLFAPAGARILRGDPVEEFAVAEEGMLGLEPVVIADDERVVGEIQWIDHFGNAITAIEATAVRQLGPEPELRLAGLRLRGIHDTYADVEPLTPLAYVGSAGTIEFAVRDGDLSERFGVERGTRVEVRPAPER